ncbi:MAG: ferredoxin family protein [Chloroflexi bacterium]|jgi:NAD-dependent dihydropyrimidine dehydrogenase PreA subunit|nr:ferredoxin family protein [Anaerolineaceae bacterium]NLI44364.1 ferredoxin family protein [Chloroflexota bacterium]HOE34400.1 ferredoxin family protein [Anaerolineaceae bacterium]HOT25409.1 ferredoxin family protein [Anaerolineaceae bacterium]HQH57395.1 ferredoxin family protein [Anaerolineaceae bacterium]
MDKLSYQLVMIDGVPAGLLGLSELFEQLYQEGVLPYDSELAGKLVAGVRKHNYIPKAAIESYQEALKLEYLRFYHQRKSGKPLAPRDYGLWEGRPREQIPWFPIVSRDLCNGCGACIEICPKGVFVKEDSGKVFVADPFLCIVGCCFCKSACEPKAILMPKQDMLNAYRISKK